MSDESQDTLLEELKNLSKTLKTEVKKEKEAAASMPSPVSTSVPTVSAPPVTASDASITAVAAPSLTDENVGDFVLKKSEELVNQSIETVKELQTLVVGTLDVKTMLAYAELLKAATGAIDTLNSLNIEKKKQAAAKELKQMDIDSRQKAIETKKPNNTVNIIATRDEIIKMLSGDQRVEKVIEADFAETPAEPPAKP